MYAYLIFKVLCEKYDSLTEAIQVSLVASQPSMVQMMERFT